MAKPRKRLTPDYENTDPFRALPTGFPLVHSRYPAVPSGESGRLDASEPTNDKKRVESALKRAPKANKAAEERWSDVLGHVAAAKKR